MGTGNGTSIVSLTITPQQAGSSTFYCFAQACSGLSGNTMGIASLMHGSRVIGQAMMNGYAGDAGEVSIFAYVDTTGLSGSQTFDFRNHGKSDNGKFTFGVDEINDIKAAMKYANENKNINNFGIWGFSYGATASSIFNLSNEEINDKFNVVGIVADTPYFDPLEVLVDEVTKRTPLNSFLSKLLEPCLLYTSDAADE